MTKPSFYWHDYETWGANPRVDRPAQFAGIRTDENLKEIGEPLMIYSQPTPDFLPSPEAVLITGITPQLTARQGLTEAEFFRQIHAEYTQPGTCIVGYNSIRFDEEVTRFGFYRNFIDPYAYSWQNGNSRWDVLDLMRMTHALRPEGIVWPYKEDEVASFKLTDLTAANDIEQIGAHDALVDVRATIAMARLVKQQQPKLFDFYFDLRNKKRVASLINIQQSPILLHVSGMFPAELGCLAPVMPLMMHPVNSNEVICFNLRQDPQPLLSMEAEQIREKLYTRTLDLAEGEARIPLKGVALNKSPALAPVNTLTPEMAERWQVDWAQIQKHYEMLVSAPQLKSVLNDVYSSPRDVEASDPDSALYDGFISHEDRLRCNQLLAASADELAAWDTTSFNDDRLNTLLFRYRARNYPQSLNSNEQQKWQRFCQARLVDGDFGAGLTLEQFQQQLLTLAQQHEGAREQQLLNELSNYAQTLFQ